MPRRSRPDADAAAAGAAPPPPGSSAAGAPPPPQAQQLSFGGVVKAAAFAGRMTKKLNANQTKNYNQAIHAIGDDLPALDAAASTAEAAGRSTRSSMARPTSLSGGAVVAVAAGRFKRKRQAVHGPTAHELDAAADVHAAGEAADVLVRKTRSISIGGASKALNAAGKFKRTLEDSRFISSLNDDEFQLPPPDADELPPPTKKPKRPNHAAIAAARHAKAGSGTKSLCVAMLLAVLSPLLRSQAVAKAAAKEEADKKKKDAAQFKIRERQAAMLARKAAAADERAEAKRIRGEDRQVKIEAAVYAKAEAKAAKIANAKAAKEAAAEARLQDRATKRKAEEERKRELAKTKKAELDRRRKVTTHASGGSCSGPRPAKVGGRPKSVQLTPRMPDDRSVPACACIPRPHLTRTHTHTHTPHPPRH